MKISKCVDFLWNILSGNIGFRLFTIYFLWSFMMMWCVFLVFVWVIFFFDINWVWKLHVWTFSIYIFLNLWIVLNIFYFYHIILWYIIRVGRFANKYNLFQITVKYPPHQRVYSIQKYHQTMIIYYILYTIYDSWNVRAVYKNLVIHQIIEYINYIKICLKIKPPAMIHKKDDIL